MTTEETVTAQKTELQKENQSQDFSALIGVIVAAIVVTIIFIIAIFFIQVDKKIIQ